VARSTPTGVDVAIKETNYFLGVNSPFTGPRDEIYFAPLRRDSKGRPVKRSVAYITSELEYQSLFASDRYFSVRGEASPAYLYYPHVPARIKDTVPDCRIIVILRDPVERVISHYKAMINWGRETVSLEEALALEQRRIDSGWEWSWDLRGVSRCAEQIAHYLAVFPRDQIGIWRFDDLVRDPQSVYGSICTFIGVDGDIKPRQFKAMNRSGTRHTVSVNFIKRHAAPLATGAAQNACGATRKQLPVLPFPKKETAMLNSCCKANRFPAASFIAS
jgi:hypothetical protein